MQNGQNKTTTLLIAMMLVLGLAACGRPNVTNVALPPGDIGAGDIDGHDGTSGAGVVLPIAALPAPAVNPESDGPAPMAQFRTVMALTPGS